MENSLHMYIRTVPLEHSTRQANLTVTVVAVNGFILEPYICVQFMYS